MNKFIYIFLVCVFVLVIFIFTSNKTSRYVDESYTVLGADMLDILFKKYDIKPKGLIHIGAHACEERPVYHKYGLTDENIIWIEGNPDLVNNIKMNIPTAKVYQGLISDTEKEVDFVITNNLQSSSFLELKEHSVEHPDVTEEKRVKMMTTTLPKLMEVHNINPSDFDFLVMDIQCAEYLALQGMKDILDNFVGIHMEVNTKETYDTCKTLNQIEEFLKPYGFVLKDLSMTRHGWGDGYFGKL